VIIRGMLSYKEEVEELVVVDGFNDVVILISDDEAVKDEE
jgi:hypothetical protein